MIFLSTLDSAQNFIVMEDHATSQDLLWLPSKMKTSLACDIDYSSQPHCYDLRLLTVDYSADFVDYYEDLRHHLLLKNPC